MSFLSALRFAVLSFYSPDTYAQVRMNWQMKLNEALGLKIEGQDWGIENADPRRVNDFIAFFEGNITSDPWVPEALAELILQSAQEALEEDMLSNQDRKLLVAFFTKHRLKFPFAAKYWLGLNKTEWKIAQLLSESKGSVLIQNNEIER